MWVRDPSWQFVAIRKIYISDILAHFFQLGMPTPQEARQVISVQQVMKELRELVA